MTDRCAYCRRRDGGIELCRYCRRMTCASCHHGDRHLRDCDDTRQRETTR